MILVVNSGTKAEQKKLGIEFFISVEEMEQNSLKHNENGGTIMSNKLTSKVTETVHLENGKPVGKFTAADRKNSREAVSALTNLALALQEAKEREAAKNPADEAKIKFTVNDKVTEMKVNDDEPIMLNTVAMMNKPKDM